MKRTNIPMVYHDGMITVPFVMIDYSKKELRGYISRDGLYYYETFERGENVSETNSTFGRIELYALIKSYEDSAAVFGMRQQKREFNGSILPVIRYERNNRIASDRYNLLSSRNDGIVLSFLRKDLEFIYPTIHKTESKIKIFKPGDIIMALRNDPCGTFNAKDKFIISPKQHKNYQEFSDLTLTVEGDKGEMIVYAKYFKKVKQDV